MSQSAVGLLAAWLVILSMPHLGHAAAGDLDRSFGQSGLVQTDFGGGFDQVTALVLQPDGKFVAAGYAGDIGRSFAFALARYNTDGSLDPTFGQRGLRQTDFGGGFDQAYALVLQPDGKLVAAGSSGFGGSFVFALARYNTDGSLDASFGAGGLVQTDFGGGFAVATALVVQPDGKLVAAGYAEGVGGAFVFALARYNTDGTPDATFGSEGLVQTDFGGPAAASALVLQPDGQLVAAGYAGEAGSSSTFALARYNTDGTPDATFGPGGLVQTDFGGPAVASALVLQPDGQLVAAGYTSAAGSSTFALARYHADGSLDASFGPGGLVRTAFGGGFDQAYALALQPDGKFLAAGTARARRTRTFALARYRADGSLDANFGAGGLVQTDFGRRSAAAARALALQPNGQLVAAGYAGVKGGHLFIYDFALARYHGE